jgi:hypothetical protein
MTHGRQFKASNLAEWNQWRSETAQRSSPQSSEEKMQALKGNINNFHINKGNINLCGIFKGINNFHILPAFTSLLQGPAGQMPGAR